VLSTGYKINTPTLESMVEAYPNVISALLFGDVRPRCGLLVGASGGCVGKGVIEKIWPLIETSNATLPEHGGIEKEIVMVSSPEKPFVRASKEALRGDRAAISSWLVRV
jgi:hypothetical protein